MKSIHPHPSLRRLCLLSSVLCLLVLLPLRAQNLQLPAIKAAQKPKSDKWVFSILPVGIQKNPQVDYAIVTEMTNEGRKLPEPSFDNPVYYKPWPMGERDVGDAYGGTKPIPYEFLKTQLSNSLASNGYRLCDDEHPPTQVLFFTWGMHNKIDTSLGNEDDSGDTPADDGTGTGDNATGDSGDAADNGAGASAGAGNSLAAVADSSVYANLLSRAKIVGGKKFAREYAQALMDGSQAMSDFARRDDLTETLVYEIQNECYYLLVTAVDAEALKRKERKPLWTTTISTISQGIAFQSTLPMMISNVAYFFGRETNGAEIVRKRAVRQGNVTIGDATVVEYISGSIHASGTAAATPATTGTTTRKP